MRATLQGLTNNIIRAVWTFAYNTTRLFLYPLNYIFLYVVRGKKYENSVLHISYMVHVPYYTVRTLRKAGLKADYLAFGAGSTWDKSDYSISYSRWPFIKAVQEFMVFWKIVARYEIIHSHFMMMVSNTGWEYPFLKKMGRKIVVNYRGCEIRDREKNMRLHPQCNICQECDYNGRLCSGKAILHKRALARTYGDLFLVTTPDMKDFVPDATWLPFFIPEINGGDHKIDKKASGEAAGFKIVHLTNQPGIEGTEHIKKAVDDLIKKGYKISFVFLKGVPHDLAMKELATADLAVGKMKMGYYANAQIESMMLGVPTITFVRPEFMSEGLRRSGFIFADLTNLEETIEYYLINPDKLEDKRRKARESILELHDNMVLSERLISHYRSIINTPDC